MSPFLLFLEKESLIDSEFEMYCMGGFLEIASSIEILLLARIANQNPLNFGLRFFFLSIKLPVSTRRNDSQQSFITQTVAYLSFSNLLFIHLISVFWLFHAKEKNYFHREMLMKARVCISWARKCTSENT